MELSPCEQKVDNPFSFYSGIPTEIVLYSIDICRFDDNLYCVGHEMPLAVMASGILAAGKDFLFNYFHCESKMQSTGQLDIKEERVAAIKRVHRAFSKIMKLEQCHTCSCFYADMMGQILEAVRTARNTGDGKTLAPIENDFQKWLEEAKELDLHG